MLEIFVLDASVVACWLMPDEHNEQAERMMESVNKQTIYVPLHWHVEMLSVLRIGEIRKRVTGKRPILF